MRKLIALICLIFSSINGGGLVNNAAFPLSDDIDLINKMYSGMSYNEIHLLLGEPPGGLSGFWADIYYNSDDQAVIFYYDENGNVDCAILGGWSKPDKKAIDIESDKLASEDDPPIEDESPD